MIITAAATQFLFLTQEVDTNIKVLLVEQSIGIADAMAQNLLPQQPRSLLLLQQAIRLNKTLQSVVSQSLTFSNGSIPNSNFESVNHLLFVWQDARLETQWPDVVQSLELTQSVVTTIAKGTYDELILVDSALVSYSSNLTVESEISLSQGVTGYLPSRYWTAFEINVVEP